MNNSLSLLCVIVLSLCTAAAQITVAPPAHRAVGKPAPAFSFTPGTNRMLIVTVSGELTPNHPSVTYNGSAMTQAVGSNLAGSGNNGSYASVWYLPNPTVGNGALVVTTGGSVSRYNVHAIYAMLDPLPASVHRHWPTAGDPTILPRPRERKLNRPNFSRLQSSPFAIQRPSPQK